MVIRRTTETGKNLGGKIFKITEKISLWIRDPELFAGSGIIVPDPDPAKNERTDNKNFVSNFRLVNSGLCLL